MFYFQIQKEMIIFIFLFFKIIIASQVIYPPNKNIL